MVAWWYSKANKIWLRILALVVSSVFFFTQIVGASMPDRSFWAERRKARQKLLSSREKAHKSDRRKGLGKKLEEKDVAGEVSSLITPQNLFAVPSQYGTVKEIHTQGSSKKPQGMGNRLIIHIQDAHSSPEAQLNSANILKYLQNGVNRESTLPLLICVEGSSGLVDTTLLSSFPEKKIKEEVASEFLKEGKITGEEYFAITGGEKAPAVNIYGVEEKRAYEKNLKAFDEGLSSGERLRNYFRKVGEEINPLKARLYSKRLKELESKIEAYQKKKISLTQYSQYLHHLLDGSPLPLGERVRVRGKYPNFELFVEASKIENNIDFSRVDSERTKYIKELSKKLTNDELSDLLVMSLDYRLGKVTSGEYYTYLQSLSSRMGKGIRSQDPRILTELVTSKEGKNEYPNLNLYIKYNKLYDRIDQNRIFSEISELEEEVKLRLCETEEEKELVKLSRMLGVLKDLVSLKISNEDLAYYYKHRDEITPGMFSDFIKVSAGSMNRTPTESDVGATFMAPEITATFSKFEEFYKIALKRNESLVDNTISRMEKEAVKVAVLIAGGFHTPGITELLRDRNISYVVVTPRLGDSRSSDLKLSPRKKKTDLEKAIAGIVGALRPANILGEQSFQTYSVIQLNGRTLILYSQFEPREIQNAFNEIGEQWQDELADKPELSKVIKNVDFLPVVLTRGREAFALGLARGRKKILPFVFRYDAVQEKVSEVIFGEKKCKEFFLSGPFDNAAEAEVALVVLDKLPKLWPSLLTETEIMTVIFGKAQPEPMASKVSGTDVVRPKIIKIRRAEKVAIAALIKPLQKLFGTFGETLKYKLGVGSFVEEYGLFVYPLILILRVLGIISKEEFRRINNNITDIGKESLLIGYRGIPLGIGYLLYHHISPELGIAWIIITSILTGYKFITAHPEGKRGPPAAVVVFYSIAMAVILPFLGLPLRTFALPFGIHSGVNIWRNYRGKSLAIIKGKASGGRTLPVSREIREMVETGLTYQQAVNWRKLKVEQNIRLPRDFWTNHTTAKNMIFATLDTIRGFKKAREANDIKKMARLYRRHVIGYKLKDTKKYSEGGQVAFFYEGGGLKGLMTNPRDYLTKTNSAAALLRFALPGLIDLTNPDALDPLEVEINYWTDPENGRYHIFQALDTIRGFKKARENNDIKKMAELYRKHVISYKPKDTKKYSKDGQVAFFYEGGGLNGLMAYPRDYLTKTNSPAALLRFALPGLIDLTNPDALDPLEVELNYWTDPENGRYHIFQALDTIPGFKKAREVNDIKKMARLYRRHVIGYKPKDTKKYSRGGQLTFFYEVGGLRGLMCHPRDYLTKTNSPAALLRFALPGLINLTNPDALKSSEVEKSSSSAALIKSFGNRTSPVDREVQEMVERGLTYQEAVEWRKLKVEQKIRLPRDFWDNHITAKNMIFATLDTIRGFKKARENNDIKKMANLYRKHVIGYKPKDTKKYSEGGQLTFFYEVGGLNGLMAHPRNYLMKTNSPAAILRFALPALIDLTNPDALDPLEVEKSYWNDPDNGRYHIFQVLDTIPGFKKARETNDIKKMVKLYRKYVIGYKPKDTKKYSEGGQKTFFYEVGGLNGLMARPRDYLTKTNSPAALLRFALPGLINLTNPDALDPLEVETDYWTDPENARYHIFQALDTIRGFKKAREDKDIKKMANLYRKHVIGYKPKDTKKYYRGGQSTFFYEVGGLRGLMCHPRDYLTKTNSPAALLRFALPSLINLTNPDALDPLEVELNYWTDPENGRYHIFQALDTIRGFKKAREDKDIKKMANLYRRHVIGYKPKDTKKYSKGGQLTFFYEVGGLKGLMGRPKDYLTKTNSPAAILRFALPGLIDDTNPDALKSSEVEKPYKNTEIFQDRLNRYKQAAQDLEKAIKSGKESKIKKAKQRLHWEREELWLASNKRKLRVKKNVPFSVDKNTIVYDIKTKEVFTPDENEQFNIKNVRKKSEQGRLLRLSPLTISAETRKKKERLETQLYDKNMRKRRSALHQLKKMEEKGLIPKPYPVSDVFQHCHTKYSYSAYYPTATLWRGYQLGLQVVGIVDHDTIDGDIEFKKAAKILKFKKASLGAEVRATVTHSRFGKMTINSPSNVAEAYICLHGIPGYQKHKFFADIKTAKRKRFRETIATLNRICLEYLGIRLKLDYNRHVKPLAEKDNPTERHLAESIGRRINSLYHDKTERAKFIRALINQVNKEANKVAKEKKVDFQPIHLTKAKERKIANLSQTDFVGFLRDNLVKPLRIINPTTEKECPSLEQVVEYSHSQGWLVYYPYLGGGLCTAEGKREIRRFFKYLKSCGIDGIAFMPDRNTKDEIRMIRRLAKEFDLRLCNGMDVNKLGMPFTNQYSNAPELVEESLRIVKHERKLRKGRASTLGTGGIKKPQMVASFWSKEYYKRHPIRTAFVTAPLVENAILVLPVFLFLLIGPSIVGTPISVALASTWIVIASGILAFKYHKEVYEGRKTEPRPSTIEERVVIFLLFFGLGLGSLMFANAFMDWIFMDWISYFGASQSWMGGFGAWIFGITAASLGYFGGALGHSTINLTKRLTGKPLLVGGGEGQAFRAKAGGIWFWWSLIPVVSNFLGAWWLGMPRLMIVFGLVFVWAIIKYGIFMDWFISVKISQKLVEANVVVDYKEAYKLARKIDIGLSTIDYKEFKTLVKQYKALRKEVERLRKDSVPERTLQAFERALRNAPEELKGYLTERDIIPQVTDVFLDLVLSKNPIKWLVARWIMTHEEVEAQFKSHIMGMLGIFPVIGWIIRPIGYVWQRLSAILISTAALKPPESYPPFVYKVTDKIYVVQDDLLFSNIKCRLLGKKLTFGGHATLSVISKNHREDIRYLISYCEINEELKEVLINLYTTPGLAIITKSTLIKAIDFAAESVSHEKRHPAQDAFTFIEKSKLSIFYEEIKEAISRLRIEDRPSEEYRIFLEGLKTALKSIEETHDSPEEQQIELITYLTEFKRREFQIVFKTLGIDWSTLGLDEKEILDLLERLYTAGKLTKEEREALSRVRQEILRATTPPGDAERKQTKPQKKQPTKNIWTRLGGFLKSKITLGILAVIFGSFGLHATTLTQGIPTPQTSPIVAIQEGKILHITKENIESIEKSISIIWPAFEEITRADMEKHNMELFIDDTGGYCTSNLGEFHLVRLKDKPGKPIYIYLMIPGSMPKKPPSVLNRYKTSGFEIITVNNVQNPREVLYIVCFQNDNKGINQSYKLFSSEGNKLGDFSADFNPNFLKGVSCNILPAEMGKGYGETCIAWLAQQATKRYASSKYPLKLNLVNNLAIIGIAQKIFKDGTIEIYDSSKGEWPNLRDEKFDFLKRYSPFAILSNDLEKCYGELELKRKGSTSFDVVSAPEGIDISKDGLLIRVTDSSTDKPLIVKSVRSFALRGIVDRDYLKKLKIVEEPSAEPDKARTSDVEVDTQQIHDFEPVDVAMGRIKEIVEKSRNENPDMPILILLDGKHIGKTTLADAIDTTHSLKNYYENKYKNFGLDDLNQDVIVTHGDILRPLFKKKADNPDEVEAIKMFHPGMPYEVVAEDTEWIKGKLKGHNSLTYTRYLRHYIEIAFSKMKELYGTKDRIIVFDDAGSHIDFEDALNSNAPEDILIIKARLRLKPDEEDKREMSIDTSIWSSDPTSPGYTKKPADKPDRTRRTSTFGIKPLQIKQFNSFIERAIGGVGGNRYLSNEDPELQEQILADLEGIVADFESALAGKFDLKRLFVIIKRLREIGIDLDRQIPSREETFAVKGIRDFAKAIERRTCPPHLESVIRNTKDRYKTIRREVFDTLLEKIYGVTLEQVILQISETSYTYEWVWIPRASKLYTTIRSHGRHAPAFVEQQLCIKVHDDGFITYNVGHKKLALLIHHFAILETLERMESDKDDSALTENIIRERFKGRSKISVIDIEAGKGEFVENCVPFFTKIFSRVNIIGAESDKVCFEEAKARVEGIDSTRASVNIMHADPQDDITTSPYNYENVGLEDSSRDIVTINNITLDDILIDQGVRILKPDGLLFITVEQDDVTRHKDEKIKKILEGKGFKVTVFKPVPSDYPPSSPLFTSSALLVCWREEKKVLTKAAASPGDAKLPESYPPYVYKVTNQIYVIPYKLLHANILEIELGEEPTNEAMTICPSSVDDVWRSMIKGVFTELEIKDGLDETLTQLLIKLHTTPGLILFTDKVIKERTDDEIDIVLFHEKIHLVLDTFSDSEKELLRLFSQRVKETVSKLTIEDILIGKYSEEEYRQSLIIFKTELVERITESYAIGELEEIITHITVMRNLDKLFRLFGIYDATFGTFGSDKTTILDLLERLHAAGKPEQEEIEALSRVRQEILGTRTPPGDAEPSEPPRVEDEGYGIERDDVTGRIKRFDEHNNIIKVYDDDGIVWEEYEYDSDNRELKSVKLFNPVTGRYIRIHFEPPLGSGAELTSGDIYMDDGKGGFVKVGGVGCSFLEPDKITQEGITIFENYILQGIGKTVKRWLALKAYRDGKRLRFYHTYNPIAAHINSGLYLYDDNFVLTEGGWLSEGKTPLSVDESNIDKKLLEREYKFYHSGGEAFVAVEDGKIYTSNFPAGYSAYIEDMHLVVRDDKGKIVRLEHATQFCLYWDGYVNAARIVRDQRKDNYIRKVVSETAVDSIERGQALLNVLEAEKNPDFIDAIMKALGKLSGDTLKELLQAEASSLQRDVAFKAITEALKDKQKGTKGQPASFWNWLGFTIFGTTISSILSYIYFTSYFSSKAFLVGGVILPWILLSAIPLFVTFSIFTTWSNKVALTESGKTKYLPAYDRLNLVAKAIIDAEEAFHRFTTKRLPFLNWKLKDTRWFNVPWVGLAQLFDELLAKSLAPVVLIVRLGIRIFGYLRQKITLITILRLNPEWHGRTLVINDPDDPDYYINYKFATDLDPDGNALRDGRKAMIDTRECDLSDAPEVLSEVLQFKGDMNKLPELPDGISLSPNRWYFKFRCKKDARKCITRRLEDDFPGITYGKKKAKIKDSALNLNYA